MIHKPSSALVPGSCFRIDGSDIRTIVVSIEDIKPAIVVLLRTIHLYAAKVGKE